MRLSYLLPAAGIPVWGPSGSSAHVRGLCRALGQAHDLRLVAARLTDRRGEYGERVPAVDVGVAGWPSWLPRWREMAEVATARRVARRVLDDASDGWTPELVIERYSLFSDAGWRVSDALGVPWVLEVNAPLRQERARYERLLRPDWAASWERRVLRAAPAVVAVSQWLVRWLEGEIGCRNVVWVPNGVEGRVGDRARGRKRLGLVANEPAIGFVGSMKPWHGVERLPALARAAKARLVLIGEVAEPPPRVVCTGHLDGQDLADAVAALDVGLAPYPADAPPWFCPLKVLDYRAQGTPVVGSDVGDVAALVGAGGTVVPPGDDAAMLLAVRLWMGRRVPPHVRTWKSVADEIVAAGVGAGSHPGESTKPTSL